MAFVLLSFVAVRLGLMSFPARGLRGTATYTRNAGWLVPRPGYLRRVFGIAWLALIALLCCSSISYSEEALTEAKPETSESIWRLATMSLDDLSNIQVISPSKHSERITDAPAAVF